MKLSEIKPNPKNPRLIRDERFEDAENEGFTLWIPRSQIYGEYIHPEFGKVVITRPWVVMNLMQSLELEEISTVNYIDRVPEKAIPVWF